MKRLLIIILFVVTLSWAGAGSEPSQDDSQWRRVSNDRFGFVLSVPTEFKFLPPPANGDGRTLRHQDIEIRYFGSHNVLFSASEQPLKQEYDFITNIYLEQSYQITYKVLKPDFFVISGYDTKGYIFYRKTIYDKNKDIFVTFETEYPKKDQQYMDKILRKMGKDLQILN